MNIHNKFAYRVDKLSIGLGIVFLGVFRPEIFSSNVQVGIRLACLLTGMLFLVLKLKIKQFVNVALIYVIPVVLSCFVNYSQGRLPIVGVINGVQYALCIYELYLVMELFISKNKKDIIIKNLCGLSGLYCVVSIITIVFIERGGIYFLGSKYMSGYMMMFYLAIKYYADEVKIRKYLVPRVRYIVMIFLFEIAMWYIDCMTCFVAIFGMALIFFIPNRIKRAIANPWVIVSALIGSMMMAFIFAAILENRFVQYIILNVLHKSITMTGRIRYYARAMAVCSLGNIWIGYGYASDVLRRTISLGSNIQNGLFEQLLEYGIIGCAAIVVLVFLSAKQANAQAVRNWPLYVLLIGFFIAATVEVSLNRIFFMSVFVLKMLSNESIDSKYNAYLTLRKRKPNER